MNNKIFDGLVSFYGGKRKLAKHIIPHIKGDTVADVFMGGGAVSLACKASGKKVIANDIAYRSNIIAKAVVENNRERLSDEDIYSLFLPIKSAKFVSDNFVPKYFTKETADFLDLAFANVRKRISPKKELLLMVLYKFIMQSRQFGGFGHCADGKLISEGKEAELLEMSSEARAKKVEYMISHPLPILLKIKDQINGAIVDNGRENEIYQMDCFAFLEKMESEKKRIDTAYFDTPYTGSLVYSRHYKVLDQILEQKMDVNVSDDAFNKSQALSNFEKLFSSALFIPRWVISMGYNPSSEKGIKGEELLSVVEKFKKAEIKYLSHNWAINNVVARKETKQKRQDENVEYLIITK